ncbi:hypothetical protein [Stratiformator vulcanicus]|uniref:Inverse autotransporter beta-domain domain-containing protein n=1 Tax=Stratiformator vulcanicus TaxID=2527980 RepID=A0A517R7G8_9PLAN|nr:hypothetical protein [Stratiformator vulcanicus]QDT39802.1 hypothetical protein Pan189_42130 [Stratiformator vulcanicus]
MNLIGSLTSEIEVAERSSIVRRAFVKTLAIGMVVVVFGSLFDSPLGYAAEGKSDDSSESRSAADDATSQEESKQKRISKNDSKKKPKRKKSPKSRARRTKKSSANSSEAAGVLARGRHLAFETFGRDQSISTIEVMPYAIAGNAMSYVDVRGFITNETRFGGNVGVGYRRIVPSADAWYGGSLWYDGDQSTGDLYHQIGLGIDGAVGRWTANSNLYVPIVTPDSTEIVHSGFRFRGTNLLFDRTTTSGAAMTGFDTDIAVRVYGETDADTFLKIRGGSYHFFSDQTSAIHGVKAGVEAGVWGGATTLCEVTHDDAFGTNIMFGVSLEWPRFKERPNLKGPESSPVRFPNRLYNVIVSESVDVERDIAAINPRTGSPYEFSHVNTTVGAGGSGAVFDPFNNIHSAIGTNADIVFVHSGSVIDGGFDVAANQRVLGEGTQHPIEIRGVGEVILPSVSYGQPNAWPGLTGALPTIELNSSDPVRLASGTELAGFNIDGGSGTAVVVESADGSTLRDLSIRGAAAGGIRISDSTGLIELDNISIAGTGGTALSISSTIAELDVNDLKITNAVDGVSVENSFGSIDFLGETVVNSANGTGFAVRNTSAAVVVEDLSVNSAGGTGFEAINALNLTVEKGEVSSTGAAAINIADSHVDVLFQTINATGGAVGIAANRVTGFLGIEGNGVAGSGGSIRNTTNGVQIAGLERLLMQHVDFENNGTAINAASSGTVALGGIRVLNSSGHAVQAHNVDSLAIERSNFTGNGAGGLSTLRVTTDRAGDFFVGLSSININDQDGSAIEIVALGTESNANLQLIANNNEIFNDSAGARGIDLNWNGTTQVEARDNAIYLNGSGAAGMSLMNRSTDDVTDMQLYGNEIVVGANGVGIDVETEHVTNIDLVGNQLGLNGSSGTGLRFDLVDNADIVFDSNVILAKASSGTGILFEGIGGNSRAQFDDNLIELFASTPTANRGIIFQALNGPTTLFGTENNRVLNSTELLTIPAANRFGSFLLNGVRVP